MRDLVQATTAIMVAIIGAGGLVWSTVINRRTKETNATTKDVQTKVNGRLDQVLEDNHRLRVLLTEYLERDMKRGDLDA